MDDIPDSNVHGTNMGPTRVLSAPDGPMLAPWILLSGIGSVLHRIQWPVDAAVPQIADLNEIGPGM